MADVITVDEALTRIGRDFADPVDVESLTITVAAVNSNLPKVYRRLKDLDPMDPDAKEAGLLLVSRLYSRRNSPDGLVGFGDMGGTSIRNLDPDLRDLLKPFRSRKLG